MLYAQTPLTFRIHKLLLASRSVPGSYKNYLLQSFVGEWKVLYRVLMAKPEGKTPIGRTRRRWEDNIKMDLQEVGCGGMDWIELASDRDR